MMTIAQPEIQVTTAAAPGLVLRTSSTPRGETFQSQYGSTRQKDALKRCGRACGQVIVDVASAVRCGLRMA